MKDLLTLVLRIISEMLSGKTMNYSGSPMNSSVLETDGIKTEVKSLLEQKAIEAGASLAKEFSSLFDGMSPEEQEYVKKVAFLKSVKTDELSADEIIELGTHLNEAASLGLVVQKQHMAFWNKFSEIVKSIGSGLINIGSRVVATTLRSALPF